MNYNFNQDEERNADEFSFFNNKNDSIGLEPTNPFDPEYLNSMAYENLFGSQNNTNNSISIKIPKSNAEFKKPYAVKPTSSFISEKQSLTSNRSIDMTIDKDTLNTSPIKDNNSTKFFIHTTPMSSEFWKKKLEQEKIANAKRWRKKNKEMFTALEENVKSLRKKRSSLQNMDRDTLLLKQFLIKTMPDQLKSMKEELYSEDSFNSNKALLDNITKKKKDNCNLSAMNSTENNNKEEQLKKDLYLSHVAKILQGYEVFNKERAKFNEG